MLSAPLSSDLRYGQVSVFLAALVVADVLVLRRSRLHGVLIGVTAAIKLTPLIFIPMLWFAGRRRAAVTATATFAGCGLIAAVVLPGDSWRFWTVEVSRVSRLGYIESPGNQSLNGALLRFDLPPALRAVVVLIIGGAVAAVALWRAARLGRNGDWVSALIVTGAASIVLSPVSWTHHQIWLVLAVLLPVRVRHTAQGARGARNARRAWNGVVLVVMVLPVTALGPPLWSNARLLLAIVIAALLPLETLRPSRSPGSESSAYCCSMRRSHSSSGICRASAAVNGRSDGRFANQPACVSSTEYPKNARRPNAKCIAPFVLATPPGDTQAPKPRSPT
jgi:alpha-1,2-mannosyltransferase